MPKTRIYALLLAAAVLVSAAGCKTQEVSEPKDTVRPRSSDSADVPSTAEPSDDIRAEAPEKSQELPTIVPSMPEKDMPPSETQSS